MSISEIEARIADIRECALNQKDAAGAHCREDGLRNDFIAYVATDPIISRADLAKMAALVASTNGIEFPRWFS